MVPIKREYAEMLLKQALGADKQFRSDQWEAIDYIVNKKQKVLLVQSTGWGKSVVYYLSTKLLREQGYGPTILISPLLSLIRNQMVFAKKLNLSAVTINSENTEDWKEIEECIYSNFVKIACEYKRNNPELLTGDIAKIMKNSRATVRKYLMCGNKLGWCDYNGKEEHLRSNKINSMNTKKICSIPLICLDNREVFGSATSCSKSSIAILGISISQTSISNSCKNKSKTKGYQFKYISDLTSEEYIKYDIENKLKELHNNELVKAC
jgi:hypothetical protein